MKWAECGGFRETVGGLVEGVGGDRMDAQVEVMQDMEGSKELCREEA